MVSSTETAKVRDRLSNDSTIFELIPRAKHYVNQITYIEFLFRAEKPAEKMSDI